MTKLTHAFARIALVIIAFWVTGLATCFDGMAQERKVAAKNVPAEVIAAFKAAYPTATIKGYAQS